MEIENFIIRPVREDDFSGLTELVGTIADGMTSLPNNPDFLGTRIHDSIRAFYPHINQPGGEYYLFVLEDLSCNRLIGTAAILSRVGGFDPFYTYELLEEEAAYPPLNISTHLKILSLKKNHKGPSEMCSLFLHPDFRKGGLGQLLSRSRFAFIKSFPERFDGSLIAELRGYINDDGNSPFWQAVGERFFQKDYYTADILSGLGEKDFIEALMPKFPIYLNLLPYSAQAVIGKVHTDTEPAKAVLLKEGFQLTNEVDIFDAGPLMKADRDKTATWKHLTHATPEILNGEPDDGRLAIVTNGELNFRAALTKVKPVANSRLQMSSQAYDRIQSKGEVLYVIIR